MDIHPSESKSNTYQYAENIRIITNDDGSTGVACNSDGIETYYDMRIFNIKPNELSINNTGSSDSYSSNKNDERIIHIDHCRQYAVVFTRELLSDGVAYMDRIYILDFTKDPSNRPIFDDTTSNEDNGFYNGNKTFIHYSEKDKDFVKFSTNVVYNEDNDKNHFIPLDSFGDSSTIWKNHFFCTLIRKGEYGIADPVSSTMIYESDANVKIYWADGENQIQYMNLLDAYNGYYLTNSSKDSTSIVPLSTYNKLYLSELTSGSLITGVYRYTYVLTNSGGVQSGVALPSDPINLYKGAYAHFRDGDFKNGVFAVGSDSAEENSLGGPQSTETGVKLRVYVPDSFAEQYKFIRIIKIFKTATSATGESASTWSRFEDVELSSCRGDDGYVTFSDNGGATNETVIEDVEAIYESNSALSKLFKPRYLEQKDNILFAANIVQGETASTSFNVSDNGEKDGLDFRAYPFNRFGKLFLSDNESDPGRWVTIGTTGIGKSGSIRRSVHNDNILNGNDDKSEIESISNCYIDFDNNPSIENESDVDNEKSMFFGYGFDVNTDDTNNQRMYLGGCGPIISYEFVTKEIAISSNETKEGYGTYVVGGHDLSMKNGTVFSPTGDGDLKDENNNCEININSEWRSTTTSLVSGSVLSYSPCKTYKINCEPEFFDGLNTAGGYNNVFTSSKFQSLKRNEIYRYIISFRTLGGKRCASFWIADIKAPSASVIPYFTVRDVHSDGSTVFANVLGIKFKFDMIAMKYAIEAAGISWSSIDSFEILRASRSDFGDSKNLNKSILASGVLQSLFPNANSNQPWLSKLESVLSYEKEWDGTGTGDDLYNPAYYYDRSDKNKYVNPTWFLTSYGDSDCFYPNYIVKNEYGSVGYNDILNNIPYKTITKSTVDDEGKPGVTIQYNSNLTIELKDTSETPNGSNYFINQDVVALPSRFVDGVHDTSGFLNISYYDYEVHDGGNITVSLKNKLENRSNIVESDNIKTQTCGSLFPALNNEFGFISPEIESVMRVYNDLRFSNSETTFEKAFVDVGSTEPDVSDLIGGYISGSQLIGNTAIVSIVDPTDGNVEYGRYRMKHDYYGRGTNALGFLSFFSSSSSVSRYSQDMRSDEMTFKAFSSLDVSDNIENGFKNTFHWYDSDVYENSDQKWRGNTVLTNIDGDSGESGIYSCNKSAGYSSKYSTFNYTIPIDTSGSAPNQYDCHISTGGISTGCCDGLCVNGASFRSVKDSISGLGSLISKCISRDELFADAAVNTNSAYLGTMSGGNILVGRYYYQSPHLKLNEYIKPANYYLKSNTVSSLGVTDIKLDINDYKYGYLLRTDRGRIDTTNRYSSIFSNSSDIGSTFANNTSIFTYMSMAPFVIWYDSSDGRYIKVPGWVKNLFLLSPGFGTLLNFFCSPAIALSGFNTDYEFGQHMICMTGNSASDTIEYRANRTSPSHGSMLYVKTGTNNVFKQIAGCYADVVYEKPGMSLDEMNYTTTIVSDLKIKYDQAFDLSRNGRQNTIYCPAGGGLVPTELAKHTDYRLSNYGIQVTKLNNAIQYIEETIFNGDEYICMYDYVSNYLTRHTRNSLGSANANDLDTSTGIEENAKDKMSLVILADDGDRSRPLTSTSGVGPVASAFCEESISNQTHAYIPIETQVNISLQTQFRPMCSFTYDGNEKVSTQVLKDGDDFNYNKDHINGADKDSINIIKGDSSFNSNIKEEITSKGITYTSIVAYNGKKTSYTDYMSNRYNIEHVAGSYFNTLPGYGSYMGTVSASGMYETHPILQTKNSIIDTETIENSSESTEILSSSSFDCRIMWSNTKKINNKDDEYTTFLADNYLDVDSRFGPITGLHNFKNQLYFWQDSSFAMLPIHDRQVVTNEAEDTNTLLLLGTGDIAEHPQYITMDNGIASSVLDNNGKKNYASGVYTESKDSLYWYDHNKHEVIKYQGSAQYISKMKGFQSWINKYHSGFNAKLAFEFDPKYNEVLMTFLPREDMFYIADKAVQEPASTIIYNEQIEAPTTFVTNNPTFYIRMFDNLYSFDKSSILRRHNIEATTDPAKIRFSCNEDPMITKVFDNIEYSSEFDNVGINFTTINFETQSMISNNIHEIDKREDNYRAAIPRAKSDSDGLFANRMKGKYIMENFEFNNADGRFKLPYVITMYRESRI